MPFTLSLSLPYQQRGTVSAVGGFEMRGTGGYSNHNHLLHTAKVNPTKSKTKRLCKATREVGGVRRHKLESDGYHKRLVRAGSDVVDPAAAGCV
jgi:hypothetical protein